MSPFRNFPGRRWSWLLVVALVSRATSYGFSPPSTTTPIEGVLPYSVWSWVLMVVSTIIALGLVGQHRAWRRAAWIVWAGHIAAVCVYVIFSLSLLFYAIDGKGWAGLAPVVIIALLHKERAERVGKQLGDGR